MSILDDFDKIVADQVQDPVYQKRLEIQKRLEMVEWLEKYPGVWGGIAQWFVKRAVAYNNFELLPIREDTICYSIIQPFDFVRGYETEIDKDDWLNKKFMFAVRDSETKKVKTMFLTTEEYNEFVRLKYCGVYEFTG